MEMELSRLIFFIFQERNFQAQKIKTPSLKKFLIFSQKKGFSYTSGNGAFLYFKKLKP